MTTEIFYVTLMHCTGCSGLIEDVVTEIPGVKSVVVDFESGRMEVQGDSLDRGVIRKEVESAGRFRIVEDIKEVQHYIVPLKDSAPQE